MTVSLIKNKQMTADRFEYIKRKWTELSAGKPIGFDMGVYLSEKKTADRNYALAHFMNENKAFPEGTDLTETLELYF